MKLNKGDHSSVGEELLMNVSDLELKCNAIKDVVKMNIFTLEEALDIYKVDKNEYLLFISGLN